MGLFLGSFTQGNSHPFLACGQWKKVETESCVYHTKSLFILPLSPDSNHISGEIKYYKINGKYLIHLAIHMKTKSEKICSYQIER